VGEALLINQKLDDIVMALVLAIVNKVKLAGDISIMFEDTYFLEFMVIILSEINFNFALH